MSPKSFPALHKSLCAFNYFELPTHIRCVRIPSGNLFPFVPQQWRHVLLLALAFKTYFVSRQKPTRFYESFQAQTFNRAFGNISDCLRHPTLYLTLSYPYSLQLHKHTLQ